MANPIITRELISVLRSNKAIAMQVVPALVTAALVLLAWPAEGQVDQSHTQALQVFRLFGYGMAAILMLLVPAFPATSIVRERQRGTLALLLHTPMRPWSIYFGKLVGVLGFAFLPLLVSIPAATACYAMGGISLTHQLIPLYALLALVIVQYTALGLYVSSQATSIDSALRSSYGCVLVLSIFTLAPYQLVQGKPWGGVVTAALYLRDLSPLPGLMELLGQGDVGSQGLVHGSGEFLRYAMLALISTIMVMCITAFRLKPTLLDRPRSQGVITDERSFSVKAWRRFIFVVDPQRRSKPIGRFVNPVMVKEFRCRRFGRSHWLLRLVAVCAIASLVLTYLSSTATLSWGTSAISALLVLLQGSLIILLTPSLAAGLISTEIETGGWPLLCMTPLSGGRIMRGKLLSVAWTLLLLLCATLPGYVVLIFVKPSLAQQVSYVILCLVLTGIFALMLSAAISSIAQRTAVATMVAYTLLLVVCAGSMLPWLGRDAMFGHSFVEKVLTINPLAAALSVMEVPGFKQYQLVPACWYILGAAIVVCLIVIRVQVWRLSRPQ